MIKRTKNSGLVCVAVALAYIAFCGTTVSARQGDRKPYDEKLYRLTELLGAIHYLRELCAANDGQKWRDNMKALLEAEGTAPARKATMSRHFNRGYRGYSRTYRICTAPAQATLDRFVKESISITSQLIKLAR